jgi:hypothetical protein
MASSPLIYTGRVSIPETRLKTIYTCFLEDEKRSVKTTKDARFLKPSVQKLATARAMLDNSLHINPAQKPPARQLTLQCKHL